MALRILIFALVVFSMFLLPTVPTVILWDHAALQAIVIIRTPELTRFFWILTKIGSTWGLIPVSLAVTLHYLQRRRTATAAFYFISVVLLKVSEACWKVWIGRPRPVGGLEHLATFSMPSGHGINAVLIFGVLGVFCLRRFRSVWIRGSAFIFCLSGIFLIDLSRVYLGMHYPSDVLMGSLYAVVSLWLLQGVRNDLLAFSFSRGCVG